MSLLLGALCACQIAAASPPEPASAALAARARAARYQQDSALASYIAIARQRWSAGVGLAAAGGLGPLGRTRLGARFESVARMGWHHEQGGWGELLAARGVAPIAGEIEIEAADDDIAFVLPYYPGRDRLWPMTELGDAYRAARDWISHPLDAGSDSLYRFTLGGALILTLPGGEPIRLREIELHPVRPSDRLVVGSLWVAESDGALVRAAYRPSVAVDLWPLMQNEFAKDDRQVIGKFGPFRGNIEEIVIEHGLHAGRFWLPRARIVHAEGTAKGGRITISIEQTFTYEEVQALPPGVSPAPLPAHVAGAGGRNDTREWYERRRRDRPCREPAALTPRSHDDAIWANERMSVRYSDGVRIPVLLPCERQELIESPLLPPSIYGPSEELFTDVDLDRLRTETTAALAISRQADWAPQRATVHYGLDGGLLRYNRIEALSAGVRVERELGKGYRLDAMARLGIADLEPNGEFALLRGSGHGSRRLGVYRRLDTANDWGNPLGLPASLGALLLGRDDGFYYRSLGAELGGAHHRIAGNRTITWRLFAEDQRSAEVSTDASLMRLFGGPAFRANIVADEGLYAGGALQLGFGVGANPMGAQLSGTVRAEGAGGERGYGRGSLEMRLAHGLGGRTVGALTGAAGASVGELPLQRHWQLGGAQTIHAHRAGSVSGDAFWLARAELTNGFPLVRPTLFADIGWAGDRREWQAPTRTYRSVGLGIALLDGLLRLDLSRALDSSQRWSVDLFVEIR